MIGVERFEALLQTLAKINLGALQHMSVRHFPHVDCWVSTLAALGLTRIRAAAEGVFAGVHCHECTSPGFRDLQRTVSTEAASKEMTAFVKSFFESTSKLLESD